MKNKPLRLKLKVVWFENFLGFAVDQLSIEQKYALTPYYFWPKTKAWEQLKAELDSKLWLADNDKIKILKTTSEVMNYWLSNRDKETFRDLSEKFGYVEFINSK